MSFEKRCNTLLGSLVPEYAEFYESLNARIVDLMVPFSSDLYVDKAFPFAFEGKITQYVGRLMHSSSPKVLIDYHDEHIPFLDRQFKQRRRVYNKL